MGERFLVRFLSVALITGRPPFHSAPPFAVLMALDLSFPRRVGMRILQHEAKASGLWIDDLGAGIVEASRSQWRTCRPDPGSTPHEEGFSSCFCMPASFYPIDGVPAGSLCFQTST